MRLALVPPGDLLHEFIQDGEIETYHEAQKRLARTCLRDTAARRHFNGDNHRLAGIVYIETVAESGPLRPLYSDAESGLKETAAGELGLVRTENREAVDGGRIGVRGRARVREAA
jgi:hypothetical protein